jgi:two-component SAPR family response regulator
MKACELDSQPESRTDGPRRIACAAQALRLYQGRLLPADTACVWTMSPRERLQSKFLRFIMRDGRALEERGQWTEAIDRYQRALEVDDLYEEFYQRLMFCHLQLGQQTEALAIYQRCKQILLHNLGAPLSDATEELRQSALRRNS